MSISLYQIEKTELFNLSLAQLFSLPILYTAVPDIPELEIPDNISGVDFIISQSNVALGYQKQGEVVNFGGKLEYSSPNVYIKVADGLEKYNNRF